MESIIDQSSTPASFSQAITELKNVAKCAGKSSNHLLWLVLLQIDDTLYTNWYN
jgi:hypothetical protein